MRLEDSKDGSRRLFAAACRCVEFDLSDEAALQVIGKYSKQHPFATAWGSQSVLKRLRSAEQRVERGSSLQKRIIPSMLSVGQLLKHHPELRPPVITGLLRTGETMNIIAPPKYGKSWLVTALAEGDLAGRPLYLLRQSEMNTDLGTRHHYAFTHPRADLIYRDYIDNWLGRGPCAVVNDLAIVEDYEPQDQEYATVCKVLHELAHIIDRPVRNPSSRKSCSEFTTNKDLRQRHSGSLNNWMT